MPFLATLGAGSLTAYRLFRAPSFIPNYIEDVFNTYLYTGTGYSRNISTGMKLGTGFASTTNLGNLGRFSAVDFAKSGNNVYAIGNDAGNNSALFYYSNDGGASWIQHTITGSGTVLEGCAFFAGKVFVAANGGLFSGTIGVNSYGVAAYSGNQATGRIRIVNNKLFVAFFGGGTPALAYTDDGINFVSAKGYDANIAIKDITYGDGYYFIFAAVVADGATGRIYRSTDLSNWTQVYSLNFGSGNAYAPRIAYANGKLVMTGGSSTYANKVFYSTDYGSSFTTVDITGLGPQANRIDYDGTKFFLGSYGYAYSTDGVSWTSTDLYVNQFVVHSDGQYFIAHGENYPLGFVPILTSSTTVTTGNGGLVWIKGRSGTTGHKLVDTARGATNSLTTVNTSLQVAETYGVSGFNADGFRIGTDAATDASYNTSSATYVGWTFLKKPKFFDMVTFTGTGVARTVAHNLGSVPGCIIVKCTSASATNWCVYHRATSTPQSTNLYLNATDAAAASNFWNNTSPTSSVFSLGTSDQVNGNGSTYVAYLFAHDAGGFGLTGTDNVISCGSYTGNGGTQDITLGYEPQWLLIKKTSTTDINSYWVINDNMRSGLTESGGILGLQPNTTSADDALGVVTTGPRATSTGFRFVSSTLGAYNTSGETYIYIAIRRGPMKTPTSGTSVYNSTTYSGDGSATRNISSIGVNAYDLIQIRRRNGSDNGTWGTRLTGARLNTATINQEVVFNSAGAKISNLDGGYQDGVRLGPSLDSEVNASGGTYVAATFKRAPGFFDVVCYTGTGANATVTHNLGVVPELMIIKERNLSARNWGVYSATLGNTKYLFLNTTNAEQVGSTLWNNTSPTASVFTVGTSSTVNLSASTYVAYLFATCAGVSKVGSYTGTGTTLQINCGFTAGARFVMIKRTDLDGDWYFWDTARGIIAGNDPYSLINVGVAEVTNTDYIDPYNPGFELSSTAPAALNASGGTYIFLAIA